MADRKKIEGKLEIRKYEYLENKKSFLDEIKSIFGNCLRAVKKIFISGDKNKKRADTSFKLFFNQIIV